MSHVSTNGEMRLADVDVSLRYPDYVKSAPSTEHGQNGVHWYEAGSAGPQEADDLLARDGRKWLAL